MLKGSDGTLTERVRRMKYLGIIVDDALEIIVIICVKR